MATFMAVTVAIAICLLIDYFRACAMALSPRTMSISSLQ
jgi:hypothetical protein